jgi:predicted nuclease of predicted toxin-antitoxin system
MKVLVDMNLSPDWCKILQAGGWDAVHWSKIGSFLASDKEVMEYAKQNGYVVLTHDLDFSAMLAAAKAAAPSVVQVRAQDTLSAQFRNVVIGALRQFEFELMSGAIVVVDQLRARARVLPLPDPKR